MYVIKCRISKPVRRTKEGGEEPVSLPVTVILDVRVCCAHTHAGAGIMAKLTCIAKY